MKKQKGFTLVELLVVIAIIAILAAIAIYSAIQYVNKGRDATVKGNLVVLVTAGEVWYDRNSSSYTGFCGSESVIRSVAVLADQGTVLHCNVKPEGTAWAACAALNKLTSASPCESPAPCYYSPPPPIQSSYCVDNKGNKKEIDSSFCSTGITNCCVSGITNCTP